MMKIEMLRQNKIKILIEYDDLFRWGVSAENVLKNAPESKEMFAEILKKAEEETGFRCNNSKLVIESAVNSDEKILTLYVTKVATKEEDELFYKLSFDGELYGKELMFSFCSFEDIIKMCTVLNSYSGGELYTYRNNYYVSASEKLLSDMSEFGALCPESHGAIVREHGKKLTDKNAFYVIRKSFHKGTVTK